jgi:ATP-dependent Clp protease adaptor protein ClpS
MRGAKILTRKRPVTELAVAGDVTGGACFSPVNRSAMGSERSHHCERPADWLRPDRAKSAEGIPGNRNKVLRLRSDAAAPGKGNLSPRSAQDDGFLNGNVWANFVAAKPGTETSPEVVVEEKLKEAFARGWSVIVWNDPVNLMDYVVYVFKTVLKMNEKDASRHMWEVHQNGKSMVARETREKSELIVHRLRGFGLNATLEEA